MMYWLLCLAYIGVRQELQYQEYRGAYEGTESWMLYSAATLEIVFKTLFAPLILFGDVAFYVADTFNTDTRND